MAGCKVRKLTKRKLDRRYDGAIVYYFSITVNDGAYSADIVIQCVLIELTV